jgi:hypothetical protein
MPLKRCQALSFLLFLHLLPGMVVVGQQRKFSFNAEAGILFSLGQWTYKEATNGGFGVHNMPYRLPVMRLRIGADYALDPNLSIGLQAGVNQVYLVERLDTYVNMTFFPIAGKVEYNFYRTGVHTFFVSAGGGLHILRLGGEGNRGGLLYTLAIGKRRRISKRIDFFYKAGFEHHAHKIWVRDYDENLQLMETPHTNMILVGMGFCFR